VTTVTRLVAGVVTSTTRQLHEELAAMPDPVQRRTLDRLLDVPPGSRLSDLERWRKGPAPRGSGPSLVKYLDRAAEIGGVGLGRLGAEALVPPRRMAELARYGMTASASLIRRHGDARRLATLVATVRHLEGKSIDDALELLDLMMSAELLGKAQREADKENARRHPRLARASARLAVAVEALFESDGWGGQGQEPRVSEVWQAIEAVVSRADLRAALTVVTETVPPAGGPDPDDWRAALPARYPAVSGFLKMLPAVIEFGASAEGAPVLAAMQALPDVLAYRGRLPAPLIPGRLIEAGVVSGPWRRLVFGHPAYEDGAVSRHAYAFCVLEQFWRGLKRRDIWAEASTRWRNPQARLLEGAAWTAARDDVLTSLGLPGEPAALLAGHSRTLDAAYREVGGRLAVNTEVSVDDDGKIHLTGLKAVEEPPSLAGLRARTTAMLPRVDLPEVLLEVMSWVPELAGAFTAASGGRSRLDDLPTSIAACLAAHAMNIGYRPIAKKGAPALERSRLSHVFQNYVRPETLAAANAPLVGRQAGLPLAQAWGGGLVAAVDGMRFVVPVPAAFARPNRKYFGSKRGMTWLNAMNDRGMGRGAKIVSGTVRDSLHMIDVIFGLDGGPLPEIVVTDTGSYSDVVFGLLELLGISYRPALADLPDQKGWRISKSADYGPLSTFARGRVDTAKIRRNWEDILRVVASIHGHGARLRRGRHAAARRAPNGARRGDRDVRADLQDPAHPQLHRRRRGLPARHQGYPQPAGRPPRARPEDLPRPQGRAVPPLRARTGGPSSAPSDSSSTASCCGPPSTWTPPSASSGPRATRCSRRTWPGFLPLSDGTSASTAPTASSCRTWPPVPSASYATLTPATTMTSDAALVRPTRSPRQIARRSGPCDQPQSNRQLADGRELRSGDDGGLGGLRLGQLAVERGATDAESCSDIPGGGGAVLVGHQRGQCLALRRG
jgi:hypothetical protein